MKLANKYFKNVKNFRDFNLNKFNQASYDGNVFLKKISIIISHILPNFLNKIFAIFLLDSILICKNKKWYQTYYLVKKNFLKKMGI